MIFILIIVALLFIVFVVALVMEKEYNIQAETVINRSRERVFNYIKYIKNQEKYSKWVMMDPDIKIIYTGVDGTVGFKSSWQSDMKNVGVGEQEIIKIVEGDGYDAEIRFEKPFKGISTAQVRTEAISENTTRVTTTFYSKAPMPMNLMVPMVKKMLKKDMDENMGNLKTVLEKQ